MQRSLISLSCTIVSIMAIHSEPFKAVPKKIAESLGISINSEAPLAKELNTKGILSGPYGIQTAAEKNLPIFKQFPKLSQTIPHIPCAHLPTPIESLQSLKIYLNNNCKELLIKRDDLTGAHPHKKNMYGGNKVRKLEFLLGQALSYHAKEVITLGAAGSNHAVATALYAHQFGLKCTNLLMPQINSNVVQQNLLLAHSARAKLLYFSDNDTRNICTFSEWLNGYNRTGIYPYIIPKGGSNSIGTLGFVNAALELKQQIDAAILEEPDVIYVATGTLGTVAGLALGFQLVGLNSHIMAIATEHHDAAAYQQALEDLYRETNILLHEKDNTIPLLPFPKSLVTIRFEFTGQSYGMPSQEGLEAQTIFKKYTKIILDNTYTSKAAAALISDIRNGLLKDKNVLFWNTYCGLDFSKITAKKSYKDLPVSFHNYFN